ncbi:MAG: hypothetical protein ABI981_07170 [Betaproteobacteria bacterium]
MLERVDGQIDRHRSAQRVGRLIRAGAGQADLRNLHFHAGVAELEPCAGIPRIRARGSGKRLDGLRVRAAGAQRNAEDVQQTGVRRRRGEPGAAMRLRRNGIALAHRDRGGELPDDGGLRQPGHRGFELAGGEIGVS